MANTICHCESTHMAQGMSLHFFQDGTFTFHGLLFLSGSLGDIQLVAKNVAHVVEPDELAGWLKLSHVATFHHSVTLVRNSLAWSCVIGESTMLHDFVQLTA